MKKKKDIYYKDLSRWSAINETKDKECLYKIDSINGEDARKVKKFKLLRKPAYIGMPTGRSGGFVYLTVDGKNISHLIEDVDEMYKQLCKIWISAGNKNDQILLDKIS